MAQPLLAVQHAQARVPVPLKEHSWLRSHRQECLCHFGVPLHMVNRRKFLQASAASFLLQTSGATTEADTRVRVQETVKSVRAEGNEYVWEWSQETDQFRLLDRWGLTIADGTLQPAVLVQPQGKPGARCLSGQPRAGRFAEMRLRFTTRE